MKYEHQSLKVEAGVQDAEIAAAVAVVVAVLGEFPTRSLGLGSSQLMWAAWLLIRLAREVGTAIPRVTKAKMMV